MTELLMLWLAQSCPLPCRNVDLFPAQFKDLGVKSMGKITHTLMCRQAHPRTRSSPHVESYFNCFVSMVPSERERSWGLQFTRHICRCCISNWETQVVRKNAYTDTGTQIEEYTDRLSLPLSRSHTHTHTLQVQHCSVLPSTASSRRKCWHIWARWNWKSLNICVSFYEKYWL